MVADADVTDKIAVGLGLEPGCEPAVLLGGSLDKFHSAVFEQDIAAAIEVAWLIPGDNGICRREHAVIRDKAIIGSKSFLADNLVFSFFVKGAFKKDTLIGNKAVVVGVCIEISSGVCGLLAILLVLIGAAAGIGFGVIICSCILIEIG